jgi:hypothetical protein
LTRALNMCTKDERRSVVTAPAFKMGVRAPSAIARKICLASTVPATVL